MQRRAAAAYIAFFLVIAAGSYGVIATASSPQPGFTAGQADHVVKQNNTFSIGDRQYTVQSVSVEELSGGHGSGGGSQQKAMLAWTNQSGQYTDSWSQNQTVTYQGSEYQVVIPNESDPSQITLRNESVPKGSKIINRSGTRYVVNDTDGDGNYQEESGTPVDEYAGFERITIQENSQIDYNGNQTQVGNITASTVPLSWTAPKTNTVEIIAGGDVTINGETFAAYGENDKTVLLASNTSETYTQYHEGEEAVATFHERMSGFWGVTILSSLAAILVIMLAYLPTKD